MNDGYSDDETLELTEEEQHNQNRSSNDRIRRSCASTDIAALMDDDMDDDSGREDVEEHCEDLPQTLIEYYSTRFKANYNARWTQPVPLDDRFIEIFDTVVKMCEAGHADGTVDVFIQECLMPLLQKWYCVGDAIDHWPNEAFEAILYQVQVRVVKMVRGLILAGVGTRDINQLLWEMLTHVVGEPNIKVNAHVGDRLLYLRIDDVDESEEPGFIKPDWITNHTPWVKYARTMVLHFGRDALAATRTFFERNITSSTSLPELVMYLKAFKVMMYMVTHEVGFSVFASITYASADRLTQASEEEMSCKNLRGPLETHPLYALYSSVNPYMANLGANENHLLLYQWRLRFLLKALIEAPFNGRMGAVESLTQMVGEFVQKMDGREALATLIKWLEEERAVDMLTRDNLHNASYVDRVQKTFERMLYAKAFTTGDLSTVWEAQRGKHDVIQRNLAELIIRIVPFFDNDLIEGLFLKIQAGWLDGGVRERDMLIDIVRRIGENAARNMSTRQISEQDNALFCKSLDTIWNFIRHPGTARDTENMALQAHLKLLEDSVRLGQHFVKAYSMLCAQDIQKGDDMAATAASHLVHILELAADEEDEDDETDYGSDHSFGRHDLIGSLEHSHSLVRSLCANIASCVQRTDEEGYERRTALGSFLSALGFVLRENRDQLTLGEQHASDIWQALISHPVMDYDVRIGFKFFLTVVEYGAMDTQMQKLFYHTYVLEVPPESVSIDGYNCFEAFFKAVNEVEGKEVLRPEHFLGYEYVRELLLKGAPAVSSRAGRLWCEYLQRLIDRMRDPAVTARLVDREVFLIMEQYASMAESVRAARQRGMAAPMSNPLFDEKKEQTQRCIKMLHMLVQDTDDGVGVARRANPSLATAAIGRPIHVSFKVPRREWDTHNYKLSRVGSSARSDFRAEDFDGYVEVHSNTTIAEMRESIKTSLDEKLSRGRRGGSDDDPFEHFLLVIGGIGENGGGKKVVFTDYKRTLGEIGVAETVDVDIRLNKTTSPRNGDGSDSSTSDGDWMSPEEMEEDVERESILPSRALAANESMIDRLLQVAECEDVDVAMAAFRLLMMVPQNKTKFDELRDAMHSEQRLRALLETASDPRFLYYLMMLESIILPAVELTKNPSRMEIKMTAKYGQAIDAMMMFVRVLPHVAELSKIMRRNASFRSLAIVSITHILHLACMTATRVVSTYRFRSNNAMGSQVISLLRLTFVQLSTKWPKYIRMRRVSSAYADNLDKDKGEELVRLVEANTSLQLHFVCAVILSGATFQSCSPLAVESGVVLTELIDSPLPMIDDATFYDDPCAMAALIESAVYTLALLAASCPQPCAEFIGAVTAAPSPVWVHTLFAATFHRADSVRLMSGSLAVSMVEVVRSSLRVAGFLEDGGQVSLTEAVLDLLPYCKGTERYADQFVLLVTECVNRTQSWNAELAGLNKHIDQGVDFLEKALLLSNTDQTPFPDETYLRARIEVLRILIRSTSDRQRALLGSEPEGPRLCERLLADFIFPAARVADAAAAAVTAAESNAASGFEEALPRSSTHMEMNSSSSLWELTATSSTLPRSASALPIPSTRRVAVCSGHESQDGVFNLLLALCDGVPENQILMQQTIHRLFYSNPWTDKKDFEYLPHHVLRQDGDLVGLKNGGATCYMNSIFQQLFMIDEVREAVLNATIPEKVLLERRTSDSSSAAVIIGGGDAGAASGASTSTSSAPPAPDRGEYAVKVLAAVQTLFAHLLGSELESYRPAEFWKVFAFKPNGESVNVREQQDAVEFHNMVTELIDEGLKKCGAEAVCEKTFRGIFADEKICKDCPHRFTKEEVFESLSLDVRSHSSLKESLKEYVKGDVLENDNAYHCEVCNKKVKAIKRMAPSKLPEVLIVQLKRFDFDWEKEISVKFNDYFEFPFELDIQPYTVEGLEKVERGELLVHNRDYQYMLRGVVVHSGQAQGGHYTSYIRNRETGKWFKFDDAEVSQWDATENGAQNRWFGCSDSGHDSMGRGRRTKARITYWNAYMLFYEKLETANRYLNPSSVASDMSTSSGVSSMTTTMTTIISSAVAPPGPSSSVSPSSMTTSTSTASTMTPAASVAPTTTPSATPDAAAAAGGAVSPTMKMSRNGKSVSPVSNLHRHFSSLSLSSARIRMPPRLEEMLREGNRRVQLERVQYSTYYFQFISSATSRAIVTARGLQPEPESRLLLETMKSFASFIAHNGLFASSDLMNNDGIGKCSFTIWQQYMRQLLESQPARLWFITHVLFSHEIAACFMFASHKEVREFFRKLVKDTMIAVEQGRDLSKACLDKEVASPVAHTLAQALRIFPKLEFLLANLLGMLPYKHNAAFRAEPIDFYRTIIELADSKMLRAIICGGILNNLLALFSPAHIHTDLSSLQRRDSTPGGTVYEGLHRVIAEGLRCIRLENENPMSNKDVIIKRTEMPDLKVLADFLQKDGGHVKFMQHLVDFLRRATISHQPHWAMVGVVWLCHEVETASGVVMDAMCSGMSMALTDTAWNCLMTTLQSIFRIDDKWMEARFEHLFFKVQLTSTHAHPSVQGLVEYASLNETRYESVIRVLMAAINGGFPREALMTLMDRNERAHAMLNSLRTYAICKPNGKQAQALLTWFATEEAITAAAREAAAAAAAAASTSTAEKEEEQATTAESVSESAAAGDASPSSTAMEQDGQESEEQQAARSSASATRGGWSDADRPSTHANNKEYILSSSAGQLSPSSRLGAMTLTSAGEKRPLPPYEEDEESDGCPSSDRKRSIGETKEGGRVKWTTATGSAAGVAAPSPARTENRAVSPLGSEYEKRPLPPYELEESMLPSSAVSGGGATSAASFVDSTITPPVPPPTPPARIENRALSPLGSGYDSRPLPPPYESTTSARIEDRTASPMDDSDLLISSSTPSTSKAPPSQPPPAYSPPAYSSLGGGGGAFAPVRATPPPVPPRPAPVRLQETKSSDSDEFVEKHKHE